MKIKRVVFTSVIVFLLALVGCYENEVDGDGSIDPPTIKGFVQIDDIEYDMQSGGYSWQRQQGSETIIVQTDHAGPVQIAQDYEAISVKPADIIYINIKEQPTLEVFLWNDEMPNEITVNENQINVPKNKGQYIYEVVATWSDEVADWESGEISYTFVVDVR